MLCALADLEFRPGRASPLVKLCEAGACYGWESLESAGKSDFLTAVSRKAKGSLILDLRRNLERATRPCLDLRRTSFGLALNSIGILAGPTDPKLVDQMFLGDKPGHRLLILFKDFPVLARLWCQSISQWREHVTEVLARFAADRRALARTFFSEPVGKIVNVQFGLSDPHHSGRTVARLQCEAGSIIYKPREGTGESEWFSLLGWMNGKQFRPKLRIARLLQRKNYCWMEYVEAASCKNEAEARRFYQRMGALIAVAYLLKAVDCHRDNLIASGEDPVLVDVDALWHVSVSSKSQSFSDVLHRTGFFPTANPRSLQSRSSALGPWGAGNHVPRLAGRPLKAASYHEEIAVGFLRAWHCILATRPRRHAFERRLRRIRSAERRWIYRATEKYAAIRKASIQPPVLRSGAERDRLIRRLCSRDTVRSAVVDAEVLALKHLDIPYFKHATNAMLPSDTLPIAREVIKTIRAALPDPRRARR
jgi:lantibiotic modifying enzyme